MRWRRTRGRTRTSWGWVFLLSALVQLPLFLYFAHYVGQPGQAQAKRPMRMKLTGYRAPPLREPPEVPEPLPEDGQIVELPERDEPEPEERVETRRLASQSSKVLKETRSKRIAPTDRAKEQGKVKPSEPSPVRSRESTSPDPTVTSASEQRLALAAPREERPEAAHGTQRPRSVLYDGQQTEILLPASTKSSTMANLQGLADEFASDDHLPEVTERSQSTVLNANKYKYADFFYRVKDAVRRHWHPDRVYRLRDPTGRAYGVKDRYTVLTVTLDDVGALKSVDTERRSGLDFMDDEARAAFARAQPFPNPPSGLVDANAEVKFQFGFFFEISSGKHRFQWKRL